MKGSLIRHLDQTDFDSEDNITTTMEVPGGSLCWISAQQGRITMRVTDRSNFGLGLNYATHLNIIDDVVTIGDPTNFLHGLTSFMTPIGLTRFLRKNESKIQRGRGPICYINDPRSGYVPRPRETMGRFFIYVQFNRRLLEDQKNQEERWPMVFIYRVNDGQPIQVVSPDRLELRRVLQHGPTSSSRERKEPSKSIKLFIPEDDYRLFFGEEEHRGADPIMTKHGYRVLVAPIPSAHRLPYLTMTGPARQRFHDIDFQS